VQLSTKLPAYYKIRLSLLPSQEPTTGLQSKPDQYIPQPHSLYPRVGSDFLCHQVIPRRFYLPVKTLNTVHFSLHILHVVPNSTITRALDGYCPKVFSRKEEKKKWREKIMVLRNKVDKGTTEIWRWR
jgi:hypothetical protein